MVDFDKGGQFIIGLLRQAGLENDEIKQLACWLLNDLGYLVSLTDWPEKKEAAT